MSKSRNKIGPGTQNIKYFQGENFQRTWGTSWDIFSEDSDGFRVKIGRSLKEEDDLGLQRSTRDFGWKLDATLEKDEKVWFKEGRLGQENEPRIPPLYFLSWFLNRGADGTNNYQGLTAVIDWDHGIIPYYHRRFWEVETAAIIIESWISSIPKRLTRVLF